MSNLNDPRNDLEALFLAQRVALLAFLRSRGVGEAAEDLLQDLWLRLPREAAHIHTPLPYLYRMANSLVIDLNRRDVRTRQRDHAWSEATGPTLPERSDEPAADRILEGREMAAGVLAALSAEGERVAHIFRRHRVEGATQREIAIELRVSIGTVEGDLRRAYRALVRFRERHDKV